MIWLSIFSKLFADLIKPTSYAPEKMYFHGFNIGLAKLKSQSILYESTTRRERFETVPYNHSPCVAFGDSALFIYSSLFPSTIH